MTLDQILIVMLPADALGEAGKSGRTEKMTMEAAGAAGCDLSKIFGGKKSKVAEILERRKQGAVVVDGALLTKQQQREQRRREMERRKAEEQAAQGA